MHSICEKPFVENPNFFFPQMLAFVIVPALLAVVSAAPGGYTGLGGMYKNMQVGSTLYVPISKYYLQEGNGILLYHLPLLFCYIDERAFSKTCSFLEERLISRNEICFADAPRDYAPRQDGGKHGQEVRLRTGGNNFAFEQVGQFLYGGHYLLTPLVLAFSIPNNYLFAALKN